MKNLIKKKLTSRIYDEGESLYNHEATEEEVNAIEIPKGATNLELLAGQHDKIHPVGDTQMGITLDCDWWNAPFKKEV